MTAPLSSRAQVSPAKGRIPECVQVQCRCQPKQGLRKDPQSSSKAFQIICLAAIAGMRSQAGSKLKIVSSTDRHLSLIHVWRVQTQFHHLGTRPAYSLDSN